MASWESFGIFTANFKYSCRYFRQSLAAAHEFALAAPPKGQWGWGFESFCSLPVRPCHTVAITFNRNFNMLRATAEHFVPAHIFAHCHCWRMAARDTELAVLCFFLVFSLSFPFVVSSLPAFLLLGYHLLKTTLYVPSVQCARFCWQHQSENLLSGASCFTGWAIYCWHLK